MQKVRSQTNLRGTREPGPLRGRSVGRLGRAQGRLDSSPRNPEHTARTQHRPVTAHVTSQARPAPPRPRPRRVRLGPGREIRPVRLRRAGAARGDPAALPACPARADVAQLRPAAAAAAAAGSAAAAAAAAAIGVGPSSVRPVPAHRPAPRPARPAAAAARPAPGKDATGRGQRERW